MAIEIFPVIHLKSASQARDQADMAFGLEADGVYLIDHEHPDTGPLMSAYNGVAADHRSKFVGLNLLQLARPAMAFDALTRWYQQGWLERLPNGLWADNAGADYEGVDLGALRESEPWLGSVKYLGGVAFKGTRLYTDDPAEAATLAEWLAPYVDVVTTSGRGTGHAPSLDKIAAMKQAIGDQSLAVASGISADNLEPFMGSIDQLLVATSVETEPGSGIFDEAELRRLIDLAHSL